MSDKFNPSDYSSNPADDQRFRTDAIRAAGLEGHPEADKAYNLAWRLGHASGREDVYIYLLDFAELIRTGPHAPLLKDGQPDA